MKSILEKVKTTAEHFKIMENHVKMLFCSKELFEIYEAYRWIPVEERMPTEEDADTRGNVLWMSKIGLGGVVVMRWDESPTYHDETVRTHWQRIIPPDAP
jgi:hypothetical protein